MPLSWNEIRYRAIAFSREWQAAAARAVEAAAQVVLDARAQYPTSMLAALYDPLAMPAPLLKAHQQLDRAADRCYWPEPFPSDRHRVEYLFALYEQLTAPLVAAAKPVRRGRKAQAAP